MNALPPTLRTLLHPRALVLAGMALTLSLPYRAGHLFPQVWHGYVVLTVVLALLTAVFLCVPGGTSAAPPPGNRLILTATGILILLAAGIRIHWMRAYPVEARYGDMLPLIELAGRRFLSGQYPYTEYHLPWPLPLTFFPLLWMSYLPALLLEIDLRWVGLAATLGVMALFGIRRPAALLPLAAFALLPVFSFFTVNGHTQPFWFFLAAHAFFLTRRNPIPAALCLGLALAARQTGIVVAPFAALTWLRGHGWRTTLICTGVTGAVTAMICLPFFLIDPDAFLLEPLRHYHEIAEAYRSGAADAARLMETFGFANLLASLERSAWLGPARALVLLGGIAGAVRFARQPADHIAWAAATGIFFTFFTPIPWIYAYFPFWVLAVFAIPALPPPAESTHD